MNKASTFAILLITFTTVSCSPSSVESFAAGLDGASSTAQPAVSKYDCTGRASGTFSSTSARLNISADDHTSIARGIFTINGRSYQMSGTQVSVYGGVGVSLRGVGEGGDVNARINGLSLSGNYKATVNNYKLDMICSSI